MDDQNELRIWILNKDLISKTPQYYRQETIFINTWDLVEALIQNYSKVGLSSEPGQGPERSIQLVYADIKDHVLGVKLDRLIEVLKTFKRHNSDEGLIGERELRRVLRDYLEDATDFHLTTIISALRVVKQPGDGSLFQQFSIDEVVREIGQMK